MESPNPVPSTLPQDTGGLLSGAQARFRRIFVPVDYSVESRSTVAVALELQRVFGSDLCLFHVHHGGTSDEFLGGLGARVGDGSAEAKGRLWRFVHNIAPGIDAQVDTRARISGEGEKEKVFVAEATDWQATVIVLTETLHSKLFRSLAEQVVRKSGIAVIVLPGDRGSPSGIAT
jgi:nucleotide-binding universal stress UspA family protein